MMKVNIELLLLFLVVTIFTPSLFNTVSGEKAASPVIEDIKAEKVGLKTHDNTVKEEEEAISDDGFSVADKKLLRGEEDHKFQAEINQLMGIIVNSLYSNRDIFVRELISNAADALAKVKFLSLTNDQILGDTPNFEIRIKADKENNILHIRDTGIGMTKQELINNLGNIAKSGTKDFLKKYTGSADLDTIGQFGVGFYSAFLVADKVTVTSKNPDDDQYVWESAANDAASFVVAKDPRGNTLGRGTLISLHLKEDALEYLEHDRLKTLILKFNEFITYPIYLWTSKEVTRDEEVAPEAPKDESNVEEIQVSEDSEEEVKPTTKKITETVTEWERQNPNPPLWTRPRSDISEEEYQNFYRDVLKGTDEPMYYTHFKAEGDVEFNSLLYVPKELPYGFFEKKAPNDLKLYVKRVFITDDFENLLPSYLGFIKGIVDSDDLPLNVSREMLQQDKTLSVIKKKLTRKIIAMFQEIAQEPEKYDKFFENFGTSIKLGIIQDTQNRTRLAKLLKFFTANSPDKKITLDQYIENMKKDQKVIYYLGGETKEQILGSSLLERLTKKGYDVLVLPDPIDEYAVATLQKYEENTFTDISKEGLKIGDDEEKKKKLAEEFQPLTDYLKDILKEKVAKVEVSTLLSSSPTAIVSQSWGYSANMERIMKAQALQDKSFMARAGMKRVLEINCKHPVIIKLLEKVNSGETEDVEDVAKLLYGTAVLNSGFALDQPTEMTDLVNKFVSKSLDVDPDFVPEEEPQDETPEVPLTEESHEHNTDEHENVEL